MTMLIRDIRCIDGPAADARDHVDVTVVDERISAIEAHDPARILAPDTQVLQGAGRTLLPGLIDAHAHSPTSTARSPV